MTAVLGSLTVRAVRLHDVPGICQVHAGSVGPWVDPVECAVFVNHRLRRPFLCCVADSDGRIVGHAEWIADRAPPGPGRLYLGMLQVHRDWQRRGVGRRLVAGGEDLARREGCARLRTIPDSGAEGFYERCGFEMVEVAASFWQPVADVQLPPGWRRARTVPAWVPRRHALRLGWVQASAAHMWEICNRPAGLAGDEYRHPCLARKDGRAFAQVRFEGVTEGLALAWSEPEVPLAQLLAAALHLGAGHGLARLLVALPAQAALDLPAEAQPAGQSRVVERPVGRGPVT